MIDEYDPLKAPDPEQWLEIDEDERNELIREYHENAGIELEFIALLTHVGLHLVVENQVAMSDETNVSATLQRLMDEGLDRHQAMHAIGLVLMEHMHNAVSGDGDRETLMKDYYRKLEKLTADKWLRMDDL